jgi:hypothetical protein
MPTVSVELRNIAGTERAGRHNLRCHRQSGCRRRRLRHNRQFRLKSKFVNGLIRDSLGLAARLPWSRNEPRVPVIRPWRGNLNRWPPVHARAPVEAEHGR